ncbi:hypothetical protein JCM12141A_26700 [Mycolicibacterium hodleri]
MNNPISADTGSTPGAADGATTSGASRADGTTEVPFGVRVGAPAEPIVNVHKGSLQSVDAAGPAATTPLVTVVGP